MSDERVMELEMDLEMNRETLVAALEAAKRVVSRASTLPVLSHFLLDADENGLTVAGTNLDATVVARAVADVGVPGAITVPAESFYGMMKLLWHDRVSLSVDAGTKTLEMKCGTVDARFKGYDQDEFPVFSNEPPTVEVVFDTDQFRALVDQVGLTAAADMSRPTLMGILFVFEGDEVAAVATDGFRLAERVTVLSSPVDEPFEVLVPASLLKDVSRLAKGEERVVAQLRPEADGSPRIHFQLGPVRATCQLLAGNFPEYDSVFPVGWEHVIRVRRDVLKRAADTVHVVAREVSNSCHLTFEPGANGSAEGKVVVTASSNELGDGVIEVPIHFEKGGHPDENGDPLVIATNVTYLREHLRSMESEWVDLHVNNQFEPYMLRPVDADEDLRCLIMPMQFRD